MAIRIQIRRDTAANWISANPTLRAGEIGIETDTLKMKVGNGTSTWTSLTNYMNITPSSLNTTLNGYLEVTDLNDSVAALNGVQNLLIPNDSIIFEGATDDSYELTLQATDPTADRTIVLPDRDGTVITTGDTGTVTNTMLAGSIANNKLANSSVTINGYEISLGGSASYGTDNIGEGTTNLYFTNERAQDAVATALSNGTHTNISVSYDDNANAISLTGAVTYTDENARDAAAGLITGSTHSGISVAYTDDGANAGELAFTNTDKGSSQNIFKNIVVGATTVVADSNNDTLTIVGSNGVGALANATNDVIEIYNTGVTSLTGTANEVEVDTSTGSVIVGLPNNVTISGNLTLSNSPTQASHAATKAYVDNTTAGLNFHAPVHAATTANLTATYNNGTSGVGATLTNSGTNAALSIDGHSVAQDERVLVKNQTTASQNGLYTVTTVGDGSTPWVLTRATDADNSPAGEIAYGDFCFVQDGTVNAGYGYIVNTSGTITIGTTSISYVQFNAGQTVIAGNGLTESTPGTFTIDTTITADVSTAQTFTNKTLTNPNINESVALTATATELNILDGATLSTTELNYVDGVTSAIQTQLDGKVDESIITAKGDLYVGSASATLDNLAVGTDGYLLTADSSQTLGVKWAAAPISLPTQTGNNGKYLTTDGSSASWAAIPVTSEATTSAVGTVYGYTNANGNNSVTVLGYHALDSGTTLVDGYINSSRTVAIGYNAGKLAEYADTVTAIGVNALYNQSDPAYAVAIGDSSMWNGAGGGDTTAVGNFTLGNLTTGSRNNAFAGDALSRITTGNDNNAFGYGSSSWITTGSNNNAFGNFSLGGAYSSAAGNSAFGHHSLRAVTTGTNNIGIGNSAGYSGTNNLTTGSNNIIIGYNAEASDATVSNEVTVGNSSITTFRVPGLGINWTSSNVPVALPSQTGNSGKYLTTNGSSASWASLVVPIETGTATLSANTATTISTTALSAFTSIEYMVSLKQGSKVRTSKVVLQTDGTSVDMTEFAITETGGTMSGVVISATTASTNAVLQATVTDAASTNVTVKFSKVAL